MYTIKQIIDNQNNFRKSMLTWLSKELRESKKTLVGIKTGDEYINEQVERLKSRFKSTTYKKEIDKLFFMHPNRNEEFYAWWDEKQEEVVILRYGKK